MSAILSPIAEQILKIVCDYSQLPHAILNAQCRNLGKTPAEVAPSDIEPLAERIQHAVTMFTNPAKDAEAKRRILALT